MSGPDPSDLRRIQDALSASEARKSALFAASFGAILTIDDEGRIVEVNQAAEQMFGLRAGDVVGAPMDELIVPPELRDAHRAGLRRLKAGHEARILGRRIELLAQRVDGTRFPVELAIARIEAGPRTLYTGFLLDLTAQKLQEARLLEQQRLAQFERAIGLTVSSTPELDDMLQRCAEHMVEHLDASFARIWTLEEKGKVLHLRCSAGLYTHLDGQHSRVPIGKFKIGRIAQEQEPHLTNAVIGDERVHDQEWARREGMVAFAGYPLLIEGRTVGVMALFAKHELTGQTLDVMQVAAHPIALGIERKRVENKLRRKARALMRANDRKNEFLAMLGHELRNPIQVVQDCFELVRAGKASNVEFDTVEKQLVQLTRLVDDILDISKVVLGQVKLQTCVISVQDLLVHAANSMRTLVERRGQRLVVQNSGGEGVYVDVDEVRLIQVVTNLINNASKYSEPDTSVRLTLRVEEREVLLEVADEGIGIDAEFLPEVFEMFSQADRALHRSRGGLGLGLPLAKRIVEQLGGTIEAASPGLGAGSTFTVRLPRVDPPEPAAAPTADSTPTSGAADGQEAIARRVLVVEDNEDAAESLALLIRALGAGEVKVARDGPTALATAEAFLPELVLLDIGLPHMDGYEVASRLRRTAATASARLVALTGHGGAEHAARGKEAGFDHHVVKPLRREALLALLRGEAPPGA